jgi:hypothetical protein
MREILTGHRRKHHAFGPAGRTGKIPAMPFTEYFVAADDDTARTAIDGGPDRADFPAFFLKNFDPVVNLGNLEAFLTERSYDEVAGTPRQGEPITDTDGVDAFVVSVTDVLRDALAIAGPDAVQAAAQYLASTDELATWDEAVLIETVEGLAGLARQAEDGHLYCYWAL